MNAACRVVARRAYSTRSYIPPNLANGVKSAGPKAESGDLSGLVEFYKRIPKGAAEAAKPTNWIARYRAKYWEGENASFTPILHAMLLVGGLHYTLAYNFHLKNHKNVEHH